MTRFLASALLVTACAAPDPITEGDVQRVLAAQAETWNRGDLEAFVETYWDDPRLTFCGSRGISRGRADVLANYQKGYPTAAARGQLTFELLDVRSIGANAALVLGRYQLDRSKPASGFFTLIVERRGGGLYITHDHTSGS